MRFSGCPFWLVAVFVGAVCGQTIEHANAQASLPQDVLQASADLTPDQQKAIDAFVEAQVKNLSDSDPEQVALGRSVLVEPFSLSNSPQFLSYYQQTIATRTAPLLDSSGPLITRLNVAIISAKLSGESLVQILEAGADDPSPAVRYWIAKAVGQAAKSDQLTTAQQRSVLTVLTRRLKEEDASLVLGQVMLAMSEIQLPEAIKSVLEGLTSRVSFHENNPKAEYQPVYRGLQQLWRKLIALEASGQNVDQDMRELARIAYRYYALAANQLGEGAGGEEVEEDKINMVTLSRQVLDYVINKNGLAQPPAIDTIVVAKNWDELILTADRWRELLKSPPISFTDQQLNSND